MAFTSGATNLDRADTDALYDIYVKDLVSGDITLASTTDAGTTGNKGSYRPTITGDGTALPQGPFV